MKDLTTKSHSFVLGRNYLVRGTMASVGRLAQITDTDLVLENASLILDTGVLSEALNTGLFQEVEKLPNEVILPRADIKDVFPWKHPLPPKSVYMYTRPVNWSI